MAILNDHGLRQAATTIMIYAVSGEGKTGQIGVLAEERFLQDGKKTLLFGMDHGRHETISHLIEAGCIDLVPMLGVAQPWEWADHISQGLIPLGDGTWKVLDPEEYGIVAFDGATGLGEIFLGDLRSRAGRGANVTGQAPAIKFKEGDTNVVNNAPAHYGIAQQRLIQTIQQSFSIPVDLVVWTALAKDASDETTSSAIVGPQMPGKAITASVPQSFVYTFRLAAIPGNPALGTVATTRLYLHPHMEGVTAGSRGLANPRGPVGEDIPDFIEPASVPEALRIIGKAKENAKRKFEEKVAAMKLRLKVS